MNTVDELRMLLDLYDEVRDLRRLFGVDNAIDVPSRVRATCRKAIALASDVKRLTSEAATLHAKMESVRLEVSEHVSDIGLHPGSFESIPESVRLLRDLLDGKRDDDA
jgi:hypothetical protein